MHGTCHDFVVLMTVKDGQLRPTGETHGGSAVQDYPFYKQFKESLKLPTEQRKYRSILDVGSLDICGCQRKYDYLGNPPLWLNQVSDTGAYIGVDLMAGNNVDIVMDSHKLSFDDKSFDLVMSLNVLEHDSDAAQTIKECWRVLEDGGDFIITCSDETHPAHGELGGGSDHYDGITREDFHEMVLKGCPGGVMQYYQYNSDHYAYIQKPLIAVAKKATKKK